MTILLLLLGCVSETEFWDDNVNLSCKRAEECSADFDELWGDRDTCEAELATLYTDVESCFSAKCTYQKDNARKCLSDMRWSSCAKYSEGSEACDHVYVCDDEVDLAFCLAGTLF